MRKLTTGTFCFGKVLARQNIATPSMQESRFRRALCKLHITERAAANVLLPLLLLLVLVVGVVGRCC